MSPLRDHSNPHDASPALSVLMLVGNTCVNDTRVLKEAQSLLAAGYRVSVLCDDDHGRCGDAVQDGVPLRRVDMSLLASLPAWLQRVLNRVRGAHGPRPAAGVAPVAVAVAPRTPRWLNLGPLRLIIKLLRQRAIRRAAVARCGNERVQVVHAHDLETLPAALRLAERAGARLVYDAHELERHSVGLSKIESVALGWQETRLLRKVARVITVSDSIARFLARACRMPLPLVVMNSPNLNQQRRVAQDLRAQLGLSNEQPLAVYIGRLAAHRGIDELLPALSAWPALHLACVGGRDAAFAAALARRAQAQGVAARLHLVDAVSPFELIDFIRSADVAVVLVQGVCLSYLYSLPNKLFEATFAGLPVCASDLPEQRRFVEEVGNGVLVDGRDSNAITRGLREAYQRRAEFRLAPARLAELAERYAWQAQSRKLLSMYEALR
ncbi:MAG: glycosyltransferase family 4 protein [Gammaproteobacteria bacterium]|nr:glycosyltransferase family 4 protein [Gammaproteobacteria bacterium]